MSLKILITGASGFIGSNLVNELGENGNSIFALTRAKTNLCKTVTWAKWQLGQALPKTAQQSFDVAIHLAYDFNSSDIENKNVNGTVNIVNELRNLGVKKQIFFSSLSAHKNAASKYGTIKYEIEKKLANYSDIIIVRPGLVLGDGGIYGRIKSWIKNHSIVPLPDGGKGLISFISMKELSNKIQKIILMNNDIKEFNIFESQTLSLRQLVIHEAEIQKRKLFIVPVPSTMLLRVLALLEAIKVPLPVNSDNLAGFLANQANSFEATQID